MQDSDRDPKDALFQISKITAARGSGGKSLQNLIVKEVTIKNVAMSRVVLEFSKSTQSLDIGLISTDLSKEDMSAVAKPDNVNTAQYRIINNPLVTYRGKDVKLSKIFDDVCQLAGWSYYKSNEGVHFTDNPRYFVVSKHLSQGDNYVAPDANSNIAGNNILNLQIKKVCFTKLTMVAALQKIDDAIAVARAEHPIFYRWYYPTVTARKLPLVSFRASNISLRELLDELCRQTSWRYRQHYNTVTFEVDP